MTNLKIIKKITYYLSMIAVIISAFLVIGFIIISWLANIIYLTIDFVNFWIDIMSFLTNMKCIPYNNTSHNCIINTIIVVYLYLYNIIFPFLLYVIFLKIKSKKIYACSFCIIICYIGKYVCNIPKIHELLYIMYPISSIYVIFNFSSAFKKIKLHTRNNQIVPEISI